MKVFLSPSNQPRNRCVLGHSEKDHCEELARLMLPHLASRGIQYRFRQPGHTMTMAGKDADSWGADLYLPIHTNATAAGKARGTTFGYYPGRMDSKEAGLVFVEHWKRVYPLPDRVRVGTYTFTEARVPKAPSVYIELLFHDNLQDATWFHQNMELSARTLVDAIYDYGMKKGLLSKPAQPAEPPAPKPEKSIVEGHTVKFVVKRAENAEHFGVPLGAVVELPIEDYLMGVVPAEIGNAHIEACKAQAIAARSLAYFWTQGGAVIDDTSAKQVYRGPRAIDKAYFNAHNAVKQTEGQVLLYNGKIAQTYFADSNGGKMVASKEHWVADLPYLVTKDDPWTKASGMPYNGHPVGMSQQGAIWAAKNGVNHIDILSFYYPGTKIHPSSSAKPSEEKPIVVLYKAEAVTRNPLSLNIWATASKSRSLKLIPRGATVNVLEEVSSTWAFVEYEGVRGYVDRQYLKKLADKQDDTQDNTQDSQSEQKPEEKPSDVLYRSVVRTRFPLSLNLWRQANKVSSIRKIPNGATVDVLKEVTHIWAKVRYNGEVGYVDRQYLEKEGKPQQTVLYKATVKTMYPLSLNIWREPRKGVSLTKVPRGAEVSVLQEVDATWAKVAYGKFVGYSDRKYLIKKGK